MTPSRPLTCTRCHTTIIVHELPRLFIDPERYVCGECVSPSRTQMEMAERTETRRYDPSIASLPEGF